MRENRFMVLLYSVVPSLASLAPERQQNSNHDQLIKKNFEFEISAWIYLSIILFLIGFMIYLMIKLIKIEEKMQNLQMNQSFLRQ